MENVGCVVLIISIVTYITLAATIQDRRKYIFVITICITLFTVSTLVFIISLVVLQTARGDDSLKLREYIPTIALFTMIFTGIGTFSTLILGWRNEIRNTTETKLKIEKLELEIAELKSKKEEKEKIIIASKPS